MILQGCASLRCVVLLYGVVYMSGILSKVASATFVVSGTAMFAIGVLFVVEGLAQSNPWKLLTAWFIFCPLILALIHSYMTSES